MMDSHGAGSAFVAVDCKRDSHPQQRTFGRLLTQFQIACMTLPYGGFPLQRALSGIKVAGYEYVAWGTRHVETPGGERVPILPSDASSSPRRRSRSSNWIP